MTDNRSERLRQRRKQSTERIEREQTREAEFEAAASAQPSNPPEPSQTDGGAEADDGGHETVSVKEEQIGTYMYLPESQTKELRRLYNVLKAEYEFEFEEEFEKNRHFYPLVVQHGLDRLEGMDAAEIRTHLEDVV
ncbi:MULTISPECIES: hypothetical protein [Salinibaculum]|uniref:hypothetical protein n=1 Tax=Salinibaculum TaxID=2732368 RepID=UPI0030CFAEF8